MKRDADHALYWVGAVAALGWVAIAVALIIRPWVP